MLITLFGPPGSGKTTLGDRLEHEFGFRHLALGRMIRSGELAALTGMQEEQLRLAVATGVTISGPQLFSWLDRTVETSPNGVIVDGYPREPNALEAFNALVRRMGRRRKIIALHLLCSMQEVLRRMSVRRRGDDQLVLMQGRYKEYVQVQHPLLANLDSTVHVLAIDAESGDANLVLHDAMTALRLVGLSLGRSDAELGASE